ncbi:hypothetical protein WA1_20160 [Scytonema hofmannii PCC 7110]|uniref:Uncharacterized protein n=1 Tax=Scytonema hofmannii PCC 7110 TaxID=128403 RepID=A0A139XC66_9CYAN|nr:YbaY family lipoprotein [Scytonema hofmannii]KYC42291.1 hypothetical protein WA1_20160 [Scytonema hofmannii PCC 7110]
MSSNNALSLVKGEILFGEEINTFSGATVNVYLEDVTDVDASSRIVAKQVIPDVSHQIGTQNRIEFALKSQIVDMCASYSIRVHVSLHGNEQIQRGDYITMESYPVLTFEYPLQVSVRVREVK